MIRAEICTTGPQLWLTLEGHAGFAGTGQDLICANASGLVYALALTLQEMAQEGKLLLPGCEQVLESGYARLRTVPQPAHRAEVEAVYRMALHGLRSIAESYGEFLELVEHAGKDSAPLRSSE